jgi:hypothetical protein
MERIGERLVASGAMKPEDVESVLRLQSNGDPRLFGEIAADENYIRVSDLVYCLAGEKHSRGDFV